MPKARMDSAAISTVFCRDIDLFWDKLPNITFIPLAIPANLKRYVQPAWRSFWLSGGGVVKKTDFCAYPLKIRHEVNTFEVPRNRS